MRISNEILWRGYDEERALYGKEDLVLKYCTFSGDAEGESPLKECRDCLLSCCAFTQRYACWHNIGIILDGVEFYPRARAPLWYSQSITLMDSKVYAPKALRECSQVMIDHTHIESNEFGWSTRLLRMQDSVVKGNYPFLHSSNAEISGTHFQSNYALQYVDHASLSHCEIRGKDALWHSRNAYVHDSVLFGEYAGWYSDGLTLVRCTIIGSQPFCYCKNLRLVDCRVINANLAFEKSDVIADLLAPINSIKNPRSGRITVPEVGEIIRDDPASQAEIIVSCETEE